jgi:hypothetical protein
LANNIAVAILIDMIQKEIIISFVSQFVCLLAGIAYFILFAGFIFNLNFNSIGFVFLIELFFILVTAPAVMVCVYRVTQILFGVRNSFYFSEKSKTSTRK